MSETMNPSRTDATPMPMSPRMKTLSAVLTFLGLITFAIMLVKDPTRAWFAYLVGFFYFFVLALGGLFFTSIQHATHAGWSVTVRRFCEAFTAFLPISFVFTLVMLFGAKHLYEWFDKVKVAADPILAHKAGYLNPTFFVIRVVLFFGLWLLFSKKLVGFSLRQDETGDDSLTPRAVPWSVAFLLVFALSFSFYGVDLFMSLQPHWFSTIFGVYLFGGLFQVVPAAMILYIQYASRKGLLTGYVNENHMHDLGKFMFAFTVFWAYIAYSQYMLIWYANLPEETVFFMPRVTGPWLYVSAALLIFKFVVPFMVLLSRKAKRNPAILGAVSILILIMHYVDIYWLAYPNLSADQVIFGLPEILIWCGFAGVFLFTSMRFLSQHKIVPVRDPRIHEALQHHVVY